MTNEHELEAYRLLPVRLSTGDSTTYGARTATEASSEAARADPLGFYNGMIVKHGKNTFVLCGPPATFIAGEEQADAQTLGSGVQLGLF